MPEVEDDELCWCGHLESEHDEDGECLFDSCDCGEFGPEDEDIEDDEDIDGDDLDDDEIAEPDLDPEPAPAPNK